MCQEGGRGAALVPLSPVKYSSNPVVAILTGRVGLLIHSELHHLVASLAVMDTYDRAEAVWACVRQDPALLHLAERVAKLNATWQLKTHAPAVRQLNLVSASRQPHIAAEHVGESDSSNRGPRSRRPGVIEAHIADGGHLKCGGGLIHHSTSKADVPAPGCCSSLNGGLSQNQLSISETDTARPRTAATAATAGGCGPIYVPEAQSARDMRRSRLFSVGRSMGRTQRCNLSLQLAQDRAACAPRDPRSPVQSVDQLYSQAIGVNELLQQRVRAWAKASRGLVPPEVRVSMTDPCSRISSASGGPGPQGSPCWDSPTLPEVRVTITDPSNSGASASETVCSGSWEGARLGDGVGATCCSGGWEGVQTACAARERLLRRHRFDVSCMTDLCRSRIAFATVEDLVAGLDAIDADPAVVLEALHNGMTDAVDALPSAGLRAVRLTLRLVSPLTCRLFLAGHVCEVTLALRDFVDLQVRRVVSLLFSGTGVCAVKWPLAQSRL